MLFEVAWHGTACMGSLDLQQPTSTVQTDCCNSLCFFTAKKLIPLDGVLELLPDPSSVPDNITGILWKSGLNKVAEWDEGFGPNVDIYSTYRNRTELDKETGKLIVRNVTKDDNGEFSVEINGRLQIMTYVVEVLSNSKYLSLTVL